MNNTEKSIENFKKLRMIASCDTISLSSLNNIIEERKMIAIKLLHETHTQEEYALSMEYLELINNQIKQVIGI